MKTHLIGIGGIGMSGIARLLLVQGESVSGSDAEENGLIRQIRSLGGQVWIGHSGSHVAGADRVVYSSSISPENPELIAARNRGIPVLHRGQIVAELAAGRRTVAVGGAHGKSTTTAMAGELLLSAGLDPLVILGAEVEALGGNARMGKGRTAVIETDESDGSLLWLKPTVAILTNVDEEHLDYFRNTGEILSAYASFADRVEPEGLLIGCIDSLLLRQILSACSRRKITYGLSAEAQLTAAEIQLTAGGSRYRCVRSGKGLGTVRLRVPGVHNVLNSLAVVGLAEAMGIDFKTAQAALGNFTGAKRRFQIQGELDGVMVVQDYGHHPAEILSTLEAARTWPAKRIRCIFQPHRYSRTRYLLRRFGSCFRLADELILLPIYAASEEPIPGVTSERLMDLVRKESRVPVSLETPDGVVQKLASDSKPGDLILFLGAGSVGELAGELVEQLKRRNGSGRPLEHVNTAGA